MHIVVWVMVHCNMVGTCCLSFQASHLRHYTLRNSVFRVPQNGGGIFIRIVKRVHLLDNTVVPGTQEYKSAPSWKSQVICRSWYFLFIHNPSEVSLDFSKGTFWSEGDLESLALSRVRWFRVSVLINVPKYFDLLQCIFHLPKKSWIQIACTNFWKIFNVWNFVCLH